MKKCVLDFLPIQRGTPTPDAPVAIEGWDEIGLGISNENLMPSEPPTTKIYARDTGGSGSTWTGTTNARVCAIIPYPYEVRLFVQKIGNNGYNLAVNDKTEIIIGERYYNLKGFTNLTGTIINTIDRKYFDLRAASITVFNNAWTTNRFMIHTGSSKATYVAPMGTIINLDFPETIYGGSLDVLTGVLSSEWGFISSYNGESLSGEWISSLDAYEEGTVPTIGAQVAYKLAEPVIYQLDPIEIKTLKGINNIWSNANGNIEVKFWSH